MATSVDQKGLTASAGKGATYAQRTAPKQEYYTCAQGKVYINEVLLDEAYDIMYSYRELKEPIYGYNSKYFDAIVPGTVIIYGSFTINYKHDAYLAKTLAKTSLKNVGSSLSDNDLKRLFEKKYESEEKAKQYLRDVTTVKAALGNRQAKEIEIALLAKEKEAFEKEKAKAEEDYKNTKQKYTDEAARIAADEENLLKTLREEDPEAYGKLVTDKAKLDEERDQRQTDAEWSQELSNNEALATLKAELATLEEKLLSSESKISEYEKKIEDIDSDLEKGKLTTDSLGQSLYLPLTPTERSEREADKQSAEIAIAALEKEIDELEDAIDAKEDEVDEQEGRVEDAQDEAQDSFENATDSIADLKEDNPNLTALDNYEQGKARYADLQTNLEQSESKRKEDAQKKEAEFKTKEDKLKQELETIKASITNSLQLASANKTIAKNIDEEIASFDGKNEDNVDKYYDSSLTNNKDVRAEDSKEAFNLLLEYGGSVHKIIEGCVLTGHVHAIQQGGDNIKEQYSFIGKKIR